MMYYGGCITMNNVNKNNIKGKKITVYQDGEVIEKGSKRKVNKVKLDKYMRRDELDLLLDKVERKMKLNK